MQEKRADFSRSCEGCEAIFTELGTHGETWYRCGEPGPWTGRVVGIAHYEPFIPAWCPKRERGEEIGKAPVRVRKTTRRKVK